MTTTVTYSCSKPKFAKALDRVFWNGTPNGEKVWEYLHGVRERFDDAAHDELLGGRGLETGG